MLQLTCSVYYLENRFPFRIAHGTRLGLDTLFVTLSDGEFTAHGEVAPVPYYGYTAHELKAAIEDHRSFIESFPLTTAEEFWAALQPRLGHLPFAQCALDIAAHDLVAQRAKKPLYAHWGLSIKQPLPLSNYTIGIGSIEEMAERMREIDFPIYKIKLGTSEDIAIVEALRKQSEAVFRVDANTAWSEEETLRNADAFKDLGVEFVEQPMKPIEWHAMERIKERSALPLIADESCQTEADVEKCIGRFHGVNIKLAKCGGLTPARRMIAAAREAGLLVMVGCMSESSIGISAIGHLLPLLDFVDMDGALLITNDPADGVKVVHGQAIFPDRNGLGVILKQGGINN